jgi:hypothetical protein
MLERGTKEEFQGMKKRIREVRKIILGIALIKNSGGVLWRK